MVRQIRIVSSSGTLVNKEHTSKEHIVSLINLFFILVLLIMNSFYTLNCKQIEVESTFGSTSSSCIGLDNNCTYPKAITKEKKKKELVEVNCENPGLLFKVKGITKADEKLLGQQRLDYYSIRKLRTKNCELTCVLRPVYFQKESILFKT